MSGSFTEHPSRDDHEAPTEPRRPSQTSNRAAAKAECERLLDKELTDTFPASDPPSWTMGGSHVSTLRP